MKLAAVLVILAATCALAQQPAVIRSETKLVLVDVVVTDKKGAYVKDLAAKDFKVWEDGKEQTIQSLALESASPIAVASHPDYMVVALDFGGMEVGEQIRARQAAQRFIDANVSSTRLVAVVNLYGGGMEIAQGFTDNAGRLKDAVITAKAAVNSTAQSNAGRGRGQNAPDPTARNPVLALKALSSLASSLSDAPGRKTLVLLTGELIVPNSQRNTLTQLIDACNRSNIAVYPVNVRDSSPQGFDAANGSVSLPAASRGGGGRGGRGGGGGGGDSDSLPSPDPEGDNQQFLLTIASGTGGFLIRNSGELPAGMQRIGEEQDQYYVIGYTPPESKEGSCHALKVKVDRSGVAVRSRADYCSEKQHELVAVNAASKDLEKHAAGSQAPTIAASMRLPFYYVSPGVARVHAVLEIQPSAIKLEKKKEGGLHADVNVLGIASTADGGTGARFSDTLTIDVADADFDRWKATPLRYEKQFKIAPGEYTLTVVFGSGGESFGKLEQPLVVDAYQANQFALSGLALSKEIRKIGAGQPLGGSLFEDRTALVTAGVELVPTGSPAFAKTDHAFCYFEIYKIDAADQPTIHVRILNAMTNQPVWDGGAGKIDLPASGKTGPVGLTLATSELPPGSYQLEVTATSGDKSGGDKSARRTVAFDIR